MSKTSEDMSSLSRLINGTNNEAEVDGAPVEFKKRGRPKKSPQEYGTWCGLSTPKEIYNVCEYLKELLEDQKKYVKALDIQIFNCAVQFYLYNQLITKMITQAEPVPVRALTTTSESFRRALGGLGLTVQDKKNAIGKADVEVNPLQVFLNEMNDDKDEDVLIKKKKGAK